MSSEVPLFTDLIFVTVIEASYVIRAILKAPYPLTFSLFTEYSGVGTIIALILHFNAGG